MPKHSSLALCFRNIKKGLRSAGVLLVCEPSLSSKNKDSWRWSLPGGKCCDNKQPINCCMETSEETVVRECKEETGFRVKAEKLFLREDKRNPETQVQYKRYVYVVNIVDGNPLGKKVFGEESPRWVPLSQLPRNLFYSHQKILEGFVLCLIKR